MMPQLHGVIASGYRGGFSPLDFFADSEDGALYDPSDLATLWQDTAGTIPVTTDGDLVARMDDLSGNNHHLIQPTSSRRPIYKTLDGVSWLHFAGNDVLRATSSTELDFDRDEAFTLSIMLDFDTTPTAFKFIMGKQASGGGKGWGLRNDGPGNREKLTLSINPSVSNTLYTSTLNDVLTGSLSLLSATYDGSSSRAGINFYLDDAVEDNDDQGSDTISNPVTNTNLFSVGAREVDIGGAIDAKFYGCVIVGDALSQEQIADYYDYLISHNT